MKPRTVRVRLDADGERVFSTSAEVDGESSVQLPCEWPTTAWSYRIEARLDDQTEWKSTVIEREGDACRSVVVRDRDHDFYFIEPCPSTVADATCD